MFVAVRPPAEVADHLEEFLEPRREAGPRGLRWSDPAQVHLTLAFLAAVPDRALDDLVDALAGAAARRRTFTARVAGGGAFPDPVGARVMWAGLELADDDRTELDRLAVCCRGAAGHAGVAVDGQRFEPHLTVARLSRPTQVMRLVGVLDTYRGPSWTVDHVALVASHLGAGPRGRPRHEVVAELPLGQGSR